MLVIIFSLVGLISSFILTLERLHILEKPDAELTCSINEVFNCAGVMNTWQAEIFGFPNSLLGIVGYTVTLTISAVILAINKNNKLIRAGCFIGSLGAFIFSYWLIHQSTYVIEVLCPYCLVSAFAATNLFFLYALDILKNNDLNLKEDTNSKVQHFVRRGWYVPVVAVWHLLIIGGLFIHYA